MCVCSVIQCEKTSLTVMPPKKPKNDFDLSSLNLPFDISKLSEDGKLIISVLMFAMKTQNDRFSEDIATKDKQICSLTDRVKVLEERLDDVFDKADDTEAAERKNHVIFSGPNIPTFVPNESCSVVTSKLLRDSYKVNLPATSIISAQRMGKPPSNFPDKRNILVKFSSHDIKKDVFQASRTVRPEGLYIRENLTTTRNSIMYVLRKSKREFPNLISGCSSIDGRVYVWLRSQNSNDSETRDSRMPINTFKKLEIFCKEVLKRTISSYIPDFAI